MKYLKRILGLYIEVWKMKPVRNEETLHLKLSPKIAIFAPLLVLFFDEINPFLNVQNGHVEPLRVVIFITAIFAILSTQILVFARKSKRSQDKFLNNGVSLNGNRKPLEEKLKLTTSILNKSFYVAVTSIGFSMLIVIINIVFH